MTTNRSESKEPLSMAEAASQELDRAFANAVNRSAKYQRETATKKGADPSVVSCLNDKDMSAFRAAQRGMEAASHVLSDEPSNQLRRAILAEAARLLLNPQKYKPTY